jgi:glycosyltransferase involved in cell wall biosynthesis
MNRSSDIVKKVLLIAHDFPPHGGIAVQRTLSSVKYLLHYGWSPIVLTIKVRPHFDHLDPTLLSKVPKSVEIYRTPSWEPSVRINRLIKSDAKSNTEKTSSHNPRHYFDIFMERAKATVGRTFFIPDRKVGWVPFALRQAENILTRNEIDLVYTTSPPLTTQLIGLFLKSRYGKPWLADFRDAWITWIGHPSADPTTRIGKWVQFFMEAKVLESADKIVTATSGIARDFFCYHPQLSQEKVITIFNGFDPDDFVDIRPRMKKSGKFRISYVGGGPSRLPTANRFLEAVGKLIEERSELLERLEVVFVGMPLNSTSYSIVDRFGLHNVLRIVRFVPHREALQYMSDSDALLLISEPGQGSNWILPGKIFEYLRIEKPILALVPHGFAKKFILENRFGITVDPFDIEGMKQRLYDLYLDHQRGEVKSEQLSSIVEQFDRRELVKKLAQEFDRLLERC